MQQAPSELRALKPNLLCIAPPYPLTSPPAGAAALLGYLKANGCHDFDFLDLRLWVPFSYAPTYRPIGAFGETYVIDVPDLPLALRMLRNFDEGKPLVPEHDELFERYCVERGINSLPLHTYLVQLDRYYAEVFSQLPDVRFVGFSTWTSNYLSTLMAAAHLKRRKSPPFIVAGGPQVTESRTAAKLGLMSGLFDAVAIGEGEETLLSLYEAFSRGGEVVEPVPGTLMRDRHSGAFVSTDRKLLRLPELPMPSFEEMPLLSYTPIVKGFRVLPYQLSRGCTDKCTFCSEWVFWKHFRLGTTDQAVEQIRQMKQTYQMDAIWFTDSLLNGKLSRLRDFAQALLDHKLDILWGGFMRADMDPDTAQLLFRAGCRTVFLGIESLSDETLERMNKRRTEADNLRGLRAFLETGMAVAAGFIPGFPGDSRDRFIRTGLLLRGLQAQYPNLRLNVEPFIISPGQPLFHKLGEYGLTPSRWEEPYLDMAGRYREIAADSYCKVDGANQGMERLGQYRVATALSTATESRDWFGYQSLESLSTQSFSYEHLVGEVYLARIKTSTSLVYGAIVTGQERRTFERMLLMTRLHDSTSEKETVGRSLLDVEPFAGATRELEEKHVVRPRSLSPRVHRCLYRQGLPPGSTLVLAPFVVGRVVEVESRRELMLVNLLRAEPVTLPAELAPLVEQLATPRTVEELLASFPDSRAVLEDLKERGLAVFHSPGEETHRPPPRPRPIPATQAHAAGGVA